jgi:hypothetical protein
MEQGSLSSMTFKPGLNSLVEKFGISENLKVKTEMIPQPYHGEHLQRVNP